MGLPRMGLPEAWIGCSAPQPTRSFTDAAQLCTNHVPLANLHLMGARWNECVHFTMCAYNMGRPYRCVHRQVSGQTQRSYVTLDSFSARFQYPDDTFARATVMLK